MKKYKIIINKEGEIIKKTNKVLIGSMLINTFLIILKLIFGFIGKSKTLISDSIHSLTDLTTDLVGIIGNTLSHKPADDMHPYGHGKLEYLTSIIVGTIIIFLGLSLVVNSVTSEASNPSKVVVLVSIITIIIKYLYSSYMIRFGKRENNNIIITSGHESLADSLTSILVILSYIFSRLTNYNNIFKYSDSVFSIIIGIYIICVGLKILKDNINNIIGKKVDDVNYLEEINNIILENKNIKRVKKMNIMMYGSYNIANIHLEFIDICIEEIKKTIKDVKKKLRNDKTKIKYIWINIE